ncbi:MAG: hypothetical protein NTY19_31845 [Planctomycetota bacterium]|nr:hypothetical protein [Planctomycetota bacterium]
MTNFDWLLDGSIVGLYLLATMVAGLMVRKYVARVDHFLVAGREMDVYLGIASIISWSPAARWTSISASHRWRRPSSAS